jgi:hypothetical protein
VTGHVKSPGRLPVPHGTTLSLRALLDRAGGCDALAATARIRITRIQPDGKMISFVKDAANDGDFLIQEDDVVYVPEKII